MKNLMMMVILCIFTLIGPAVPFGFAWGVAEGKLYDISREAATTPVAIVPGVSVGPVNLAMTKDNVVQVLGMPDAIFYGDARFSLRDSPTAAYYVFSKAGLSVFFQLEKIRSISVLSELYEYPGGIRVGTHISRAEAILGKMPTMGSVTEPDLRVVPIYKIYFSGTETYRLAYYDGVILKVNESTGLIAEMRVANADGQWPQPIVQLEEVFSPKDADARRATHERVLRDTAIPLDLYALVLVRWTLREVDKSASFREYPITEYRYVLKSASAYQESALATDSFIADLDTRGLIGPSIPEIVKTYGQPTTFVVSPVAGDNDAIRELYYGDLMLSMDTHHKSLSSIQFWSFSPLYRYKGKLGVGSTQDAVYTELGNPLRTAPQGLAGTEQDRTLFTPRKAGIGFPTILYADKGLEFQFADGKVWTFTRIWHQ